MTTLLNLNEDQRFEVKFITHNIHRQEIIQWLKLGHGNCYEPHPARWINNIYWDSQSLPTVDDHLLGSNRRTKIRFRWYGEEGFLLPGQLELKLKHNVFNRKVRYSVTSPIWEEGLGWREVRSNLSMQLPESSQWILKKYPIPTLGNKYYRTYFVSRDKTVRVTLDSKLMTCPQRFHHRPEFPRSSGLETQLIVEFKFNKTHSDNASAMMQNLPLQPTKFSKYINGLYIHWL